MEFSNDVEKYEIEVTKMDQNDPLFYSIYMLQRIQWELIAT